MLRCLNYGVMTKKPGHQTTGDVCMIWSDELSFMLFPTSGGAYVWRTTKEVYNLKCLLPAVKHGKFCDGLGSSIMVQFSVCTIITLHG
jgi:hypothetical protein